MHIGQLQFVVLIWVLVQEKKNYKNFYDNNKTIVNVKIDWIILLKNLFLEMMLLWLR